MKQKFNQILMLLLIIAFLFGGCSSGKGGKESIELQSGDLIFVSADTISNTAKMSKAINDVTRLGLKTNYSHVAIVQVEKSGISVIHAAPERGVVKEPLDDFLERKPSRPMFVYRIKSPYHASIKKALLYANNFLGKPYDHAFLMADSSQYCSGMIYRIFEETKLFELQPMTFINPDDGQFHTYWIDYFNQLGVAIPEGHPGCNPNGLASSDALDLIGAL